MGNTGPGAMKKLVASVLAGVAAQSAVLAIFELAKGFAALFFNPAEATAHFTAAALFGSIAIGTGLAGRKIAGDSFKQSASGGGSSSSTAFRDTSPQSRSSGNFQSGPIGQLSQAVAGLHSTVQTLTSMQPGALVKAGINQSPGVVGKAVHDDLSSGRMSGKRTGELIGMR